MTIAAVDPFRRHYSPAYATEAVGPESARLRAVSLDEPDDSSVTHGHAKAELFARIAEARATADHDDWDGEGSSALTARAVSQAIELLVALPSFLPAPDIAPESTGEITFEWSRDRHHVAILSVDGERIRWSAIAGQSRTSGSEVFCKTVPGAALLAIEQAAL